MVAIRSASFWNLVASVTIGFARVAERKTFINRDLDEMTVQLAVNAGPPATFGPLTFKGREAVEESYLRRLAEWPQGGAYDQRVLRDLQRQFSDTGLFSTVNAETRSEEHTSELQSLMRIS